MMEVVLAPIWEVWNWSDDDVTFWAVLALLFGAFGLGYQSALGEHSSPRPWIIVAVIAGMIGLIVLIGQYGGCDDPGGCEPPDW